MTKKIDMRYRERGSLIGPLLLIGIGLYFLLSNLGFITWGFWEMIGRLWPIILIAFGLDLLVGRRSLLGSMLVLLITLSLLAGGLYWLGWIGGSQGVVTESVTQSLAGAREAEVTIHFGVGALRLDALPAESPTLVEGEINQAGRGERIEEQFDLRNGVAHYQLRSYGPPRTLPFFNASARDWVWNLYLNRDVPLHLTIHTGVGDSDLDLSGLHLSELTVKTGVGKTTVTLPGHNRYAATIEGGVGELVVLLPEGAAARINVETGLGNVSVLGNFTQEGNVYQTAGYDEAADRLDLHLKAGIGQVTVRHYGGR